ncbi:MAG: DNA-binding protein [Burkholderiales bacterium]
MKEKKATRERVFEAADRIKALGGTPTADLVLEETGGSMRDVHPLFKAWKTQNSDQENQSSAVTKPLPSRLDTAFLQCRDTLVQVAREEANAELERERHEAQRRVNEAEHERDDLLDVVDRRCNEVQELRGRLDMTARAAADERKANELLQARLAEEKQQRLLAEAREIEVRNQVQDLIAQRESDQRTLARVQDRLTNVQRELEGERIARVQSADGEAALRRHINEVTDALEAYRGQSEARLAALTLEMNELRSHRESAKLEVARLSGELAALRAIPPATQPPKLKMKPVEARQSEGRPDA